MLSIQSDAPSGSAHHSLAHRPEEAGPPVSERPEHVLVIPGSDRRTGEESPGTAAPRGEPRYCPQRRAPVLPPEEQEEEQEEEEQKDCHIIITSLSLSRRAEDDPQRGRHDM
ncbi:hypothetical protein EYF80_065726 [Liparis tanakae]|uniref:Uncharacterized protein n=1 Tax=Liparis tanakae TaxID=230148 RepID=A0A4Z2E5W2_9TELE|nr:hypothetical protein EYF80_065726 [Liparis tanakae]